MKLNELADNEGARKDKVRVGRGIGSGMGKTSGRGIKGTKARAGSSIKGFEGGQMPLIRRLPKRGFTNAPFGNDFDVVNVGRLQEAIDDGRINAGEKIDVAVLRQANLCGKAKDGVRILGKGELKSKVTLEVAGASKTAIEAVEKLGGSIAILFVKQEPKEGTKKAKRLDAAKAKKAARAK